jgi:hypothetical protein
MIKGEGVQLEDGEYGRRAVITSSWSGGMTKYLVDNRVVELELNDGKGWRGADLSFLAELQELQSFKIIDFKISSVEPIHFLRQLRALEVITYCKSEIRFSTFPRLVECGLEWRAKALSLFDCAPLKKLFVNRYDGKNVTSFAKLTNLASLAILNAPIEELRGLGALTKLRSLRLANLKRLKSLAGIEGLVNLEELEIHTCRSIGSIEEIGSLSRLRKLHLNNDGDIESLRPLRKLAGLESVLFYESTNIVDGDLSPLLLQNKLTNVSFQNRRHYNHRREEFSEARAK